MYVAPPPTVSKASSPEPSSFIFFYAFSEFFFLFFDLKMCPKSQKMKLQKHYLEVSNSSRNEVRAFLRFTVERKNYEFFQMSQKKRLEILRCVVLLKVFSKKRSLFGSKDSATFTVGNHFESKSARYALLCRDAVAVCYSLSPPILPVLSQLTCCCCRGISRFCPASPKSAFIKNEQKAKTKTFCSDQSGAAVWPLKNFTADSPPIYRPFAALSYGRAALLPHFFTAVPLFCRTFPGLKPRTSCCCQRGISKFYPASPKSAFIKN
jgi:hypothetical protein